MWTAVVNGVQYIVDGAIVPCLLAEANGCRYPGGLRHYPGGANLVDYNVDRVTNSRGGTRPPLGNGLPLGVAAGRVTQTASHQA